MPHWEGIEDASAKPQAVWLWRTCTPSSSGDNRQQRWKPLRKVDSAALNRAKEMGHTSDCVYIDGGRRTANLGTNTIVSNFTARGGNGDGSPVREMCSAIWFVVDERGSNSETILHPIPDMADSFRIESLYQKVVQATSSLGQGIASVLSGENADVLMADGVSKIKVSKVGGVLTMRKQPAGWFQNSMVLQRGYGEYHVEGEETELALGPVRHLIFVIHGIGEAMFSRQDIKISGLLDQTDAARMKLQKLQVEEWQKQCAQAEKAGQGPPPPPHRIELIPIEWFSHIHDSSTSLMRSLNATTLPGIPALRAIANDVVFDVLMYLTPSFSQAVLQTTTEQINDAYRKFLEIHPHFLSSGGTFSLAGHSLGSVICWDLLAILKKSDLAYTTPEENRGASIELLVAEDGGAAGGGSQSVGYQVYAQNEHADKAQNGYWGPTLTKPMEQVIPFVPEYTLFLGSPLGIFLTLRGAHPVFDEMRERQAPTTDGALPKTSPFTLPTKHLYNIFNPSDPVAYRIEPLLMSQEADPEETPEPEFLVAPGKMLRLHVKAKQLGNVVRQNFLDKTAGWGNLIESAVSALGSDDSASTPGRIVGSRSINEDGGGGTKKLESVKFPLGGRTGRVDYSLQPKGVIESEYLNAVTAHSSYLTEPDIQQFIVGTFAAHDRQKEMAAAEDATRRGPAVPQAETRNPVTTKPVGGKLALGW